MNLPLVIVMLPMSIMFFISFLAETNRPPFDLPEAESELVAGYQVEYSSTPYLLFMIGEYSNIVLMCALITVLFFGGWHPGFPTPFLDAAPDWLASLFGLLVFAIKTVFWFFMVAVAKAIVPRYRYDQLMRLGWKVSCRRRWLGGGAGQRLAGVRVRAGVRTIWLPLTISALVGGCTRTVEGRLYTSTKLTRSGVRSTSGVSGRTSSTLRPDGTCDVTNMLTLVETCDRKRSAYSGRSTGLTCRTSPEGRAAPDVSAFAMAMKSMAKPKRRGTPARGDAAVAPVTRGEHALRR
jgi:hypothetical protein